MKSFILFLSLLGFITLELTAQTCCSGGVPLSGNLGLPPSTAKTWQISLSHDVNVLNTLKTGTETLDDESRKRITNSTILEIGYSINNRFSIDIFTSYVKQVREIRRFGNLNEASTQGFGDAVILLKFLVTNPSDPKNTLVLGAGPKLPTGASDRKSNGFTENADLQPGSGAWDGILWGNYLRNINLRPTTTLFSTISYAIKGTNDEYLGSEEFKFSNELQVFAGISDRLNMKTIIIDPSIGFRYRNVGQDQQNGAILPNTGGEWVFAVPAINTSISPDLSVSISTEIPLYSRLEGTQLTPTYRVNGGILYTIRSKKLDIKLP